MNSPFLLLSFLSYMYAMYDTIDGSPTGTLPSNFTIIEGDMLKPIPRQFIRPNGAPPLRGLGASVNQEDFLWPDGVIPYVIAPELEAHRCLLYSAMVHLMLNSCIRFREKLPTDQYNLLIQNNSLHYDKGCISTVGYDPDAEPPGAKVDLRDGCFDMGTVVHELMHAIGFHHEQARSDRDRYIRVYQEYTLNKASLEVNDPRNERLHTEYDTESIMHYGGGDFAKPEAKRAGFKTMEPINGRAALKEVHEKPGLSRLDVVALRKLYKCDKRPDGGKLFADEKAFVEALQHLDKVCPEAEDWGILQYYTIY